MANNRANKSSNNKSSNSSRSGSGSVNWTLIIGVCLLVVVIVALYYMKRSNEGFASGSNSKNNSISKKQSNALISGTDVKSKLNPGKGECVVALFYADWCPHCQHFKPEFQQAMDELNGKTRKNGKKMRLEMVDCEANKDIARNYDVSGYPTVKILEDDGTQVEYGGDRTFEGLRKYLVSDD
jgi:thiol-disulfide isomerase/thioredoxin